MKLATLLLLLMVVYCLIESYECGRRRRRWWRRRWVKKITKFACKAGCHWVCSGLCYRACKLCNGKRDDNIIQPFSCDFSAWDLDGDGKISRTEFRKDVRIQKEEQGRTDSIFNVADGDGNGELTAEEFKNAPLMFDGSC